MMQKENSDWDIDWDYTMGMPEDNGYALTLSTSNDYVSMTDNGVYCYGMGDRSYGYVRYAPPSETCNEGIFEAVANFPSSQNATSGFRVQVSNGTNGAQMVVRNLNVSYIAESTTSQLITVNLNTDYTLRVELIDGTAYYYLDGELLAQTTTMSTYYCTATRMFEQLGVCYLKALRFKKVS